jgi:hypothetical protein
MSTYTTFQRRFTVGPFTVNLMVRVSIVDGKAVEMEFEWSPDLPRRLSKKHQA